jgi:hypothetical protein
MRYTALILILLAGTANAETFKCRAGSYWEAGGKIVVTTTINEDGETGTINVAGVTHQATYQVQGFDRRWDFGLQDDGSYNYAFVLKPDGTAIYYDFSNAEAGEIISGSQVFSCK